MESRKRRDYAAPFTVQSLPNDGWRFSGGAHGIEVLVRRAAPAARALLESGQCQGLSVEWRGDGARIYVSAHGVRRVFEAGFVAVHEPVRDLYATLPLGRFDAAAQRFWWRIFRIARLPGGRHLISWIARRRSRTT